MVSRHNRVSREQLVLIMAGGTGIF